jgi:hypothetical protein
MSIVLPVLAVTFAACCVWLGVRIFNRRERWAKWTLAAVVCTPMLYVASFGPACWLSPARRYPLLDQPQKVAPRIYQPLGLLIVHGPAPIADALIRYAEAGGGHILIPTGKGE